MSLAAHPSVPSDPGVQFTFPNLFRKPAVGTAFLALLAVVLATRAPSASGQALPPGVVPCLTNEIPAAYGSFVIAKVTSFVQSPQGNVAEISSPSSTGWIELVSPPSVSYSNAIVSAPEGFRADLTDLGNGISRWTRDFATEVNQIVSFPDGPGSTRIDAQLPDGSAFVGFFRFSTSLRLPATPRILNPDSLTDIDSTTNIVVSWTPWAEVQPGDRVHLEIRDANEQTVFSASTGCGGEFSLAPGGTSVTLPAGRLAPRTSYTGHLTFSAGTLSAQDRGSRVILRGIQARTTRFVVRTSGASDPTTATLSEPRVSAAGTSLIFTLRGTPRAAYHIQSSTNLQTWTLDRIITLPINGAANVSLTLPKDNLPRFWRVIEPDLSASAARLSLGSFNQNRDFMQITVEGTPGVSYRVEMTSDLINWLPLTPFGVTIPSNQRFVRLGVPTPRTNRFSAFRAVAVPPR